MTVEVPGGSGEIVDSRLLQFTIEDLMEELKRRSAKAVLVCIARNRRVQMSIKADHPVEAILLFSESLSQFVRGMAKQAGGQIDGQ